MNGSTTLSAAAVAAAASKAFPPPASTLAPACAASGCAAATMPCIELIVGRLPYMVVHPVGGESERRGFIQAFGSNFDKSRHDGKGPNAMLSSGESGLPRHAE